MSQGPRKSPKSPEFGVRLTKAAEMHPQFPPMNHGQLRWVAEQFLTRFNTKVSHESVRKWFAGESYPGIDKVKMLAEIFECDFSWLASGDGANASLSERKLRDSQRSGVVNLLAGVIQMQGGHPAFPDEDEADVDMFAIIKGAQYTLKVCAGEATDDGTRFLLPPKNTRALLIGVVMKPDFCFDFYEIDTESSDMFTGRRRGEVSVIVPDEFLKPIRTFAERL